MKIYQIGLVVLSMFVFSGCFSAYEVTFDSNPRGATVQCGNKILGYAPILAHINISKEEFMGKNSQGGSFGGCYATWVSGYQKEYIGKIDFEKYPNAVGIMVERPRTEGYEKDAQFALQVQQLKYQGQQTEAAQSAADAANWNNINNSINNVNQNLQMQQLNTNLNKINNTLRYGY